MGYTYLTDAAINRALKKMRIYVHEQQQKEHSLENMRCLGWFSLLMQIIHEQECIAEGKTSRDFVEYGIY